MSRSCNTNARCCRNQRKPEGEDEKLIHHKKRENRSWCSLKALSAVKTGGSQDAALSTAIMEQTSISSTVTDAHTYLHSALTACFLHFTTSSLLVVGPEDKPVCDNTTVDLCTHVQQTSASIIKRLSEATNRSWTFWPCWEPLSHIRLVGSVLFYADSAE